MGLSVDEVRTALALSLAVDGYIDLDGLDGEQYLHGDLGEYPTRLIEAAARSLHRFLTMGPAEIETARAEVLGRRKLEGRE